MKGIVVKYNALKGFGFIRSDAYEDDIFVHIKNVSNANILALGQTVEFKIKKTLKGKTAISVIVGRKQLSPFLLYGIISIVSILLTINLMNFNIDQSYLYLIAVNIVTFIIYTYDKAIVKYHINIVRVPEFIFHILAMIGGTPAALIAQKISRHKTIKRPFQRIYWNIVKFHLLIIFGYLIYKIL